MAEGPGELTPAIAGIYNTQKAALEFSLQKTLAEGNLAKKAANQNFDFARGNVVRQEPQRFQANRNAANSAGLAESGQLAQTQQRQATNFGQQLAGLSQQRAQAVGRITMGEESASHARAIGEKQNIARANKEQLDYMIANPPATPSTPSPSPTTNLPPGYTATTQKGGSVSISPRKQAAKKYAAKLQYTGGYGKRPGYSNPGF